ncbi:transposable element Tcb2 transposase [Trichonephila clavipes]|nr:transposable element Tcb2 transposase [Trichonephila clavipes]
MDGMGLSQADAARRLNVSRSVVQRLWDQYQSEDSVSRRPVPGRPRATTPAEDRRRISAATVRNRLHNAGLYARRPVVCVPLNGRQRRNRLCWAREHVSWTQQQWASVLFTDESRFTMESDSGRLLIWREQRTRYHQSNTVERHSYRGGGILVWAGISLGGHTDLHVFHGGTVTGLRYRDEILDPYVRPYAAAIGNDFILMDDNGRPHRAGIVEEYLEDHGLERMERPARSPDLNPIEHLWDYLGREVAALNPPPRSLHELKQGLLCVWSSLPIPVSDNLINSMGNRCHQCIQNAASEKRRSLFPNGLFRFRQGASLPNDIDGSNLQPVEQQTPAVSQKTVRSPLPKGGVVSNLFRTGEDGLFLSIDVTFTSGINWWTHDSSLFTIQNRKNHCYPHGDARDFPG